jgi:Fe-S-cluster-containing hydrogenase component 2/CRP-like cAMP-binding protein
MADIALNDFSIPDADPEELGRGRGEDEALFARDEDDILIRREKETRSRFGETVRMTIDGYILDKVPRAVPKTDAAGVELRDADGGLIPRTTTIYDAAYMLVRDGRWAEDDLKQRLPVLCHQRHMTPVGMCRMCSVHVSTFKRGKLTAARKLVPSCQHRVEEGMVVTTRLGGERFKPGRKALAGLVGFARKGELRGGLAKAAAELIEREAQKAKEELEGAVKNAPGVNHSVGLLAEFLLSDHRQPALAQVDPADPNKDGRYENEMEAVARTLGCAAPRPGLPTRPPGKNARAADPADARSRRLALPIVPTTVEPEELADPRADVDWRDWNKLVDEEFPYSSRTVVVDHDRCILCDRCARACSEVKPFKVIGHTGKGGGARISFDLDRPMAASSCVQCGECMTSCPTGALSLRRRVQPRNWPDSPTQIAQDPNTPFPDGSDFLTAEEMRSVRLVYRSPRRKRSREVFPFRTIPFAYLKWNEGAVRRWVIHPGEKKILCREGEYGSTAFLLDGSGHFHIHVRGAKAAAEKSRGGLLGRLFPARGRDGGHADDDIGPRRVSLPGDQLVFGEMACLVHKPRTATVVAEAGPDAPMVVYEVTRNVLDMMQRTESARDDLREVYTARAVQTVIQDSDILADLPVEYRQRVVDFLLARIPDAQKPVRQTGGAASSMSQLDMDPWFEALYGDQALATLPDDARTAAAMYLFPLIARGLASAPALTVSAASFVLPQTAEPEKDRLEFRRLAPGEVVVAEGDTGRDFYLVRVGFLRVYTTVGGRERVVSMLSDKDHFGEVALLGDELKERGVIPAAEDTGRRTASVAAIDPSEVVRLPGDLFAELCDTFPEVRDRLLAKVEARRRPAPGNAPAPTLPAEYVTQGVYMGQRMLALDLVSCTRCDECTRACADSHDGHSRLIREGLRFGDFLVATSCRSCHKPYCMDGCPVDAIHRKGTGLQVVIEDHCIGCGLCERSCPYGAIQMVAKKDGAAGPRTAAVPRRAVNCDLCADVGGQPFCVSACPHEAAIRLDGKTLLAEVTARASRAGL